MVKKKDKKIVDSAEKIKAELKILKEKKKKLEQKEKKQKKFGLTKTAEAKKIDKKKSAEAKKIDKKKSAETKKIENKKRAEAKKIENKKRAEAKKIENKKRAEAKKIEKKKEEEAKQAEKKKEEDAKRTLEEELEEQLSDEEIENFQIEKVDMEKLTNKVCEIIAQYELEGMLQSELWKKLKLTGRDGSRLALKLERMGIITREKILEKGRWTYKLIIKKTPVSTISIEGAPCLTCPVEQKCSLEGEISPRSCQWIEDWVLIEIKKPTKTK